MIKMSSPIVIPEPVNRKRERDDKSLQDLSLQELNDEFFEALTTMKQQLDEHVSLTPEEDDYTFIYSEQEKHVFVKKMSNILQTELDNFMKTSEKLFTIEPEDNAKCYNFSDILKLTPTQLIAVKSWPKTDIFSPLATGFGNIEWPTEDFDYIEIDVLGIEKYYVPMNNAYKMNTCGFIVFICAIMKKIHIHILHERRKNDIRLEIFRTLSKCESKETHKFDPIVYHEKELLETFGEFLK